MKRYGVEVVGGAALLVCLMTKGYGREKKHAVEIDAMAAASSSSSSSSSSSKATATPALIVDLADPYGRADGEQPLLRTLLAERGSGGNGGNGDEVSVTTPSIGFFKEGGSGSGWSALLTSVPEDLSAIVMNRLIVLAKETASYSVDTSSKVTAVSNAKVRRTSEIDWESLASGGGGGGGGDDDDSGWEGGEAGEGGQQSGGAATGEEEEQMMKMFQERQALEGKGKKR